MPTKTPASLPSRSSLSPETGVSRHFVWVRCLSLSHTRTEHPDDDHWPLWLAACYQLTPHLQRFGPDVALLDLGNCTDAEAVVVVQALLTRLRSQQVTLRAAIGPSSILAQLALLHAPASAHEPLTVLTPERTGDLLRQSPITTLTRLQFADRRMITPAALAQAVELVDRYGVRSLGHLARLDETSLRRQFGARIGALLATVARGADPLPLQPTPAPLQIHFRLRLTAPIAADRLMVGFLPFTLEVASTLARRGLQGHRLELRLRWETGASERITRMLPQPIAGSRALNETVRRMLTPIFQNDARTPTPRPIEDFHLIVSSLVPRYPAQHAFWPQRVRQLAAVHELDAILTQRYSKPLLFRRVLTAPDAIFDQDRSRLAPVHADMADVLEGQEHRAARPVAEVSATSAEIPHDVHWW